MEKYSSGYLPKTLGFGGWGGVEKVKLASILLMKMVEEGQALTFLCDLKKINTECM